MVKIQPVLESLRMLVTIFLMLLRIVQDFLPKTRSRGKTGGGKGGGGGGMGGGGGGKGGGGGGGGGGHGSDGAALAGLLSLFGRF